MFKGFFLFTYGNSLWHHNISTPVPGLKLKSHEQWHFWVSITVFWVLIIRSNTVQSKHVTVSFQLARFILMPSVAFWRLGYILYRELYVLLWDSNSTENNSLLLVQKGPGPPSEDAHGWAAIQLPRLRQSLCPPGREMFTKSFSNWTNGGETHIDEILLISWSK